MENKEKSSWASQKEISRTPLPIKFTIFLVKIFPHWFLASWTFVVAFFFYVFSKRARAYARDYQKRLCAFSKNCRIKKPHPYFQILSFALGLVEKIEGWLGKTKLSDVIFFDDDSDELKAQLARGKGAYLIGSHLGNTEFIRSLASFGETGVNKQIGVTAIMDVNVNANFTKSMQQMNGNFAFDVVNASEIGTGTIEVLESRLSGGGIVFITGDRIPAAESGRTINQDFLGKTARFPYGVFFIPSLFDVPVYYVFSARSKDITISNKYNMHVIKSSVSFNGSRAERKAAIASLCREFAGHLEAMCEKYPYQWYNFFDFWQDGGKK